MPSPSREQLHADLLQKIAAGDGAGLKQDLIAHAGRFNETSFIMDLDAPDNNPYCSALHYVHQGLANKTLDGNDAQDVLQAVIPAMPLQRNSDFFHDMRQFIKDPRVNASKSAVLRTIDDQTAPLSVANAQDTPLTAAMDNYFHCDTDTQQALEPFLKHKIQHAPGTQKHGLDENYLAPQRAHLKKYFAKDPAIDANPNGFYTRLAATQFYHQAGIAASNAPPLGAKDVDATARNFQARMTMSDIGGGAGKPTDPGNLGHAFRGMVRDIGKHLVTPMYLQAMTEKGAPLPAFAPRELSDACEQKGFNVFFGQNGANEALSINKTLKLYDRWQGQRDMIKGAIPLNDQMEWTPVLNEPFVGKNGYMVREVTDYKELRGLADEFNNCAAGHLQTMLTGNGHAFVMERVLPSGEPEKLMAEFKVEEDSATGQLDFTVTEPPDRPRQKGSEEFVLRGNEEAKADFNEMTAQFKNGEISVDWTQQMADQKNRIEAAYTEVCDYNPFNPEARQAVYQAYTRFALPNNDTNYKRLKGCDTYDDFADKTNLQQDAKNTVTAQLFQKQTAQIATTPVTPDMTPEPEQPTLRAQRRLAVAV